MEKKKAYLTVKLLDAISFIIMVAVNTLAVLLQINGLTPGEVSDSYPNLFAPAGMTFSIWGFIYLLLTMHMLYLLGWFREKGKNVNADYLCKTGVAFSISSLTNAAWIFSWHYRIIPLSMILIVLLLICLIYIFIIIDKQCLSTKETIFVRLPFAVYFGWITVATIANATVLLVSLGWNGFGISEVILTIVIIAAGALIGIATLLRFRSISYGIVFIWAYIGILTKHISPSGFSNQYHGIVITLVICLALFTVVIVYTLLQRPRHPARFF